MNEQTLTEIFAAYPFAEDFFVQNRLSYTDKMQLTLSQYVAYLAENENETLSIAPNELIPMLQAYIEQMAAFLGQAQPVCSLTICAGHDKSGNPEGFSELTLQKGDVVSLVGPTGAGKSRLLADIEWTAQGDTPTGRRILVNGAVPDLKWRYTPANRLVAQLSQNMNFVIDVSAEEFLLLHAQSRQIAAPEQAVAQVLDAANRLAGEPFSPQTPVTSLSGGQSRALMIADAALLSASPIILIDEIENAGINRTQALELLLSQDKIVLMATHDPLLALMAERRLVIENGGIKAVHQTSEQERALLSALEHIDRKLLAARQALRAGQQLCLQDFEVIS